MTEQEIRDLFKKHNVPLDRDDVWKVQSALVVKHKALERLAAELNISFDSPQILRSERDEAVILATGRLVDRTEWSIGEALATDGSRPGNYKVSGKQAPYVYAMAEKRAKDRVILKLAGLHGAYSEDEADDFKEPASHSAPVESTRPPSYEELEEEITSQTTLSGLNEAMKCRTDDIERLSAKHKDDLRKTYRFKREALIKFGEAA
ncbi:hypothetical protein AB0L20_32095 [Streptomyces albidoflavus]|uniref:hypothetical protein n=1 Tax=Streptomyces albidoflavus TaxID=1886 RepID=UPI0034182C87